ncbi:hypothetical protein OAU40_02935, partial [Candidatus Pseudothioglobus singularis]|nr:hypothetical protein [Candidatus Pseudothioglobus singularis]
MYNPLPWHRGWFVDGYDIRTPLEVVHDYRESGIDAYPTAGGAGWVKNIITTKSGNQVIALSGASNVKTIFCN